jgi:hypothetical protein
MLPMVKMAPAMFPPAAIFAELICGFRISSAMYTFLVQRYHRLCCRWLGQSLAGVGHGSGAREIPGLQFGDAEACAFDKFHNLAVQVALASGGFPEWIEAVLPGNDGGIGRLTVLGKNEASYRVLVDAALRGGRGTHREWCTRSRWRRRYRCWPRREAAGPRLIARGSPPGDSS